MTADPQRDRIRTDLIWQRLIAILEDQAQMLIRTAFSTTTRESGDLSAGLFDAQGRMVAQAVTGTPGHVNAMALAVGHFLERFPLDTLRPGDVLASNDPWLCSGHLHDFTVVSPVFHRSRPVGVVANTVHVVDIGGLGFGPDGREPDQVVGDLHSSMIGNEAAAGRVSGLLAEFGCDDLQRVADSIVARTRQVVEDRIAALPDGDYANEIRMDGYEGEVELKLKLSIAGDSMTLDFAGSSLASPRGINVVLNYTTAYAVFGVNCVLNPDIPCNHGSLAPIRVLAPAGSVLNARRPAAVSARHMIGHMLPDLVLGALAPVLPVPAEGAGLIWNPSLRGATAGGRPFATVTFNAGGAGANADRDGWNTTAFPSGVKTMPVEAVEATVPILVRRKELRPDSGGPGRFKGGLGQTIELVGEGKGPLLINAMFDRLVHPARGREGGGPGQVGGIRLASGKPIESKGLQEVAPGDAVILDLPGGGGYGSPDGCERAAIKADLLGGYLTPDGVKAQYGSAADD